MASQALDTDDEFFAKFTRTQKQYFFHKDKEGVKKGQSLLLLSCLTQDLRRVSS